MPILNRPRHDQGLLKLDPKATLTPFGKIPVSKKSFPELIFHKVSKNITACLDGKISLKLKPLSLEIFKQGWSILNSRLKVTFV